MKHYTLLLCAFLALTSSCDDMLDSSLSRINRGQSFLLY